MAEAVPPPRLLLLSTANSYRSEAFGRVAASLGVEVVRGLDLPKALAGLYPTALALEFSNPEGAAADIVAAAQHTPFCAILAVDDSGSLVAA
nr:phosphoribosylglycinamide synthetase [Ardenticatenales bacterium]